MLPAREMASSARPSTWLVVRRSPRSRRDALAGGAPRARAVRAYEALARLLASRFARRLSLWLARLLLLARALVPGKLAQRAVLAWVRMEAACCRSSTPHYKLIARYLDVFERAGTLERVRASLRERPRAHAAARLDAWVRIGALGSARHEVLGRHLGSPGVPPRLLMEAQLALSPGCDLACEGCYTAADRGGPAPSRERIAYLVDEAVACGAFAVHVVGKGEPLLSPRWASELLDVIEARPHVFFTLATHGMHVDEAFAARAGRIGNLLVLVAIDGPEDLHDARRGAGSYARVHAALARLRRHGALFGYSCMVSARSYRALTSPELVRARHEAGCAVGIHSRYFALAPSAAAGLAMSAADLAEYEQRFAALRAEAPIPIFDLDEVEQHTGCHSRAGESIYIDGITGRVSPCLRVPFAPDDCRFAPSAPAADGPSADTPGRLAEILAHPYFVAYREPSGTCPSWCGASLARETSAVRELVAACSREPSPAPEPSDAPRPEPRRRTLPLLPPQARP